MVLVPFGRQEPEIEKLSSLDEEMSKILKNRKYSVLQKLKLYQNVLRKNITMEARLKQKSSPVIDHEKTNEHEIFPKNFKDEEDEIDNKSVSSEPEKIDPEIAMDTFETPQKFSPDDKQKILRDQLQLLRSFEEERFKNISNKDNKIDKKKSSRQNYHDKWRELPPSQIETRVQKLNKALFESPK